MTTYFAFRARLSSSWILTKPNENHRERKNERKKEKECVCVWRERERERERESEKQSDRVGGGQRISFLDYLPPNWEGFRSVHAKKNILHFCVNRGNKLLCFYTNVAFENIGFSCYFLSFFVCVNTALLWCLSSCPSKSAAKFPYAVFIYSKQKYIYRHFYPMTQ